MVASQLTQLKTRLKEKGLSRNNSLSSKKRKRLGPKDSAQGDRAEKLKSLHDEFNTFDTKFNRKKHDVGNTRADKGKPAQSKQAAIENRRKTLLPELLDRGRAGGVIDRRFGEDNPHLTPEEKALERFTRERQRTSSRKDVFNLEDELTHYGKSLGADDAAVGFGLGSQADMFQSHQRPDDGSDDEPERKRSTKEIMDEVIAKSKAYKYERQKAKTEDDELRMQLDDELGDLRAALGVSMPNKRKSKTEEMPKELTEAPSDIEDDQDASESDEEAPSDEGESEQEGAPIPESKVDRKLLAKLIGSPSPEPVASTSKAPAATTAPEDEDDFDRYVRELGFEKRGRPSDRLKTEEERARQAANELKAREAALQRRMQGLEDDDSEQRAKGADDLDDDFVPDDEFGLGQGLEAGDDDAMAVDVGEDDSNEESASGSEEESASEDGDEDDLMEALAEEDQDEAKGPLQPLVQSKAKRAKGAAFVLPCPEDHDEFLPLIEDRTQLATVIDRIRTLHHPSLAEDNKDKLATFLQVLIDHVLYAAATEAKPATTINVVAPHIVSLSKAHPLTAYRYFVGKLSLMQKNLARGLAAGAQNAQSKTWPGLPELSLLRLVGLVWSTSDFSHPVGAPAMLLMCQYLNQCRIRSLEDVRAGLFLSTLCLQFEKQSRRIVPEVLAFLNSALLLLAPHSFTKATLPGSFLTLDVLNEDLKPLRISAKDAKAQHSKPSLTASPSKTSLLQTAIGLCDRFARLWVSHPSFIEMFGPIRDILTGLQTKKLPSTSIESIEKCLIDLNRMLKLSESERKPLFLQYFKPAPIQTFAPRFEDGFRPGQHAFDPDTARNEQAKLKALVKKEKKGALRELRKDAKFIAEERAKMRQEKDAEYQKKLSGIYGTLREERAEEKDYERTKKRLKRMDKKRAGGK